MSDPLTVIATLAPHPTYIVGDPDVAVVTIVSADPWPFPSCPLQATFPWARASQMYDDEAGSSGTEDGFFFATNGSITIIRAGTAPGQTGVRNQATGVLYQKAKSDVFPSDLPHDAVYGLRHQNVAGGVAAWVFWNYMAFDPTDTLWWATHPLQIDLINFSADLFDPALGNGIEICCAAGAGDPGDESFRDEMIYANGPLADAANWDNHPAFGNLQVDGQIVYAPALSVQAAAILMGFTPSDDQWLATELRVWYLLAATNPRQAGVLLRYDPTAQTGYLCYAYKSAGGGSGLAGPGGTRIEKHVAGVVTVLTDVPDSPDSGSWGSEELSAEAVGTTIRVLRNGQVVATATDATIASGRMGLYLWSDATSDLLHNALQLTRGGDGPAPRRSINGHEPGVFNWGRAFPDRTIHAGDPATLPAVGEVLAHITSPAQLPFTLANPQGRAIIIRTKNQDPGSLPLGTSLLHDVNVGFSLDDPPGAYKQLRSDEPSLSSGMWTVTAASQLRIRALAHETLIGPSFLYSRGVLIYRDPVRLAGTTLRINVTDPYIWLAEDPALNYISGGMEATLTAYAVDESDMAGSSEENFAVYRGLDWTGLQARLGAVIQSQAYVTASSDAFFSGAGFFDIPLPSGRQLVWLELTAVSQPGNPNAGLHLPSILHGNPSIF